MTTAAPSASPQRRQHARNVRRGRRHCCRGRARHGRCSSRGSRGLARCCVLCTRRLSDRRGRRRCRGWRRRQAHECREQINIVLEARRRACGVFRNQGSCVFGRGIELAVRVAVALVLEEFVGDAHFDVVGFAENSNNDLFCAFQPNRAIVPSFPLRLKRPEMPSERFCCALAARDGFKRAVRDLLHQTQVRRTG